MIKKIVFIIIFLYSLTFGENCDAEDFQISCSINENLIGLYLNSFNLNTSQSSIYLFDCLVQKKANSTCDDYSNLNLIIDYNLYIQSATLGIESRRVLFSGLITVSEIYSNSIQFKNTDLNYSSSSISGSQNLNFEVVDFDFAIDVRNIMVQSGKIPNGTYTFSFKIQDCSDVSDCMSESEIKSYQPENIYLQFPGGPINELDNNFIFSTVPTFYWNSDFCNNCDVSIRVCEYDPLKHVSLNDAINDISNFPAGEFSDFSVIDFGNYISYQYPISNALPLEHGKNYVWQIKYSYLTTIGIQNIFSELFVFQVKSPYQQKLNISTTSGNQMFSVLTNILGSEKYNSLFSNGGELEAYVIENNNVFINNERVSISELLDIVKLINEKKLKFIDVKIEY